MLPFLFTELSVLLLAAVFVQHQRAPEIGGVFVHRGDDTVSYGFRLGSNAGKILKYLVIGVFIGDYVLLPLGSSPPSRAVLGDSFV